MPLQPGPFVQQSQSDVPFTAGKYDFVGDVDIDLSGLDTIGAAIDTEMVGMTLFADADETLIIGENIDGLVTDVLNSAAGLWLPQLNGVDSSMALADTQFTQAVSFAPPAAWTDPPAAYVPPVVNLPPAPTIPAGEYIAAAGAPVSGTLTGNAAGAVALSNTTRVGQPNFWVGDDFQVSIVAPAGSDVSLSSTFDGSFLGTSDYGPMPASGTMTITGTIGPENIGTWHEDWSIGGQLVASFDFLVLSA